MATENQQIDEKKLSEARIVFNTLCASLDNRQWKYNKDEEKLIVRTSAIGDDLTIKIYIKVDADRSVMFLKSPLPINVTPQNYDNLVLAATYANWAMLNGVFEIATNEDYIGFKVVVPYMDSIIGEPLCKYLIDISCRMVDIFNDKMLDVAEGRMSIADFKTFAATAV